jgi:hypothetical protein
MYMNKYRIIFLILYLCTIWSPTHAQRNNDTLTVVGGEMYGVTALRALSAQCPKRVGILIQETKTLPLECKLQGQKRFIFIRSSSLKLPRQQLCKINRDLFSPIGRSNASLDYEVTDVQPIHVACLQKGINIKFFTLLKKRVGNESADFQETVATQTLYLNEDGTYTLNSPEIYRQSAK